MGLLPTMEPRKHGTYIVQELLSIIEAQEKEISNALAALRNKGL